MLANVEFNQLNAQVQKMKNYIQVGKRKRPFEFLPATVFTDILVIDEGKKVLKIFWMAIGRAIVVNKLTNEKLVPQYIKRTVRNIGFGNIIIRFLDKNTIDNCSKYADSHALSFSGAVRSIISDYFLNQGG